MYLEISGRQTGKTTRLLEAASASLDKGHKVIIVVKSEQDIPRLEGKGVGHIVTCGQLQQFLSYAGLKPSKKVALFFDDFDSYLKPAPFLMSAYYTTTPAYIRDDPKAQGDLLLRLARYANEVKNYKNADFGKRFREERKCTHSDVIYKREVLGLYLRSQF